MCFRLKMWETVAPSAIEDFVLRQDPRAKDAWAIIASLDWLVGDSDWIHAGLSMEQLAQELRRYSYKRGTNLPRADRVLAIAINGGGLTPSPQRADTTEERREKLMQRVAKYEFRSRAAADEYWKLLLKTGLPENVLIRILRFLELRITDLTGPPMYCMRCKKDMSLAALIGHVAYSPVHIDATVA